MKSSRSAIVFIIVMAAAGLSMLAYGMMNVQSLKHYPFFVLLAVSAVASRMKLNLPGINGNMSVNLPFILIAAAELSLLEGMLIALVSSAAQTFPKAGNKLSPVKLLFNVNTMVLASGVCALLWHWQSLAGHTWSGSLPLIVSCSAFFLINTLPVATIISLTEGQGVMRIWSSILHLSFPYYLACTGLISIVSAISRQGSWAMPLAVFPVMLLMYRSYRVYFRRSAEASPAPPAKLQMAAASSS
ncbi:MAG TPA: hypothetical protein VFB00_06625 [Terriglobales bacterium]|nr:hypothetical protein [Terriglobales bacterium]